MNDTFLPANYTVPDKSNGYMKFKIGQNRIRILNSPIIGYEWWIDVDGGRKPVRVRMNGKVPMEFAETVKHFWAMPVWNYELNQIQILEITQKGIQKTIALLAKNAKWGTPTSYDLVIERSGEGLDTEYSVTPEPKEALNEDIAQALLQTAINLEALYEGKDPFAANEPLEQVELADEKELGF